jgi:hypothetical protein
VEDVSVLNITDRRNMNTFWIFGLSLGAIVCLNKKTPKETLLLQPTSEGRRSLMLCEVKEVLKERGGKNRRNSKQGPTSCVTELVRISLYFTAVQVSLPCLPSPTLHTLFHVFTLRHLSHKVICYDDRLLNSCSQPKLQNHPLLTVLDWLIAEHTCIC